MTELPEAAGWQPTLIQVGTLPMAPELLAPEGELGGHGRCAQQRPAPAGPRPDRACGRRLGAVLRHVGGRHRGSRGLAGRRRVQVRRRRPAGDDAPRLRPRRRLLRVPEARLAVPAGAAAAGHSGEPGSARARALRRRAAGLDRGRRQSGAGSGRALRARASRRGTASWSCGSTPWRVGDSTIVEVADGLWHIADVVHHPLQVATWTGIMSSTPTRETAGGRAG